MRPDLSVLDTPSVVVDIDIMERNLQSMADKCRQNHVMLRPHTKTHKCPQLALRQLQSGATGITVAKLGEAEVMAEAGIDDIFLAYELVGPQKMRRLAELLNHPRPLKLRMLVDSLAGAAALSDAAINAGACLPTLIEIDLGMKRTGVDSTEAAVSLARHLRLFPGISVIGVMGHEGRVGMGYPETMENRALQSAERLLEAADAIRSIGLECPVVSAGSTPAARFMVTVPGITELRPGTYIFNDRTQIWAGSATIEDCALTVLATVISVHPGNRIILDAGSKTMSSDGHTRFGDYGSILEDPAARIVELSEEHAHVDSTTSDHLWRVGERVHILPNHVCPVVNLTNILYGYRESQIEQEWIVAARGKVQ